MSHGLLVVVALKEEEGRYDHRGGAVEYGVGEVVGVFREELSVRLEEPGVSCFEGVDVSSAVEEGM